MLKSIDWSGLKESHIEEGKSAMAQTRKLKKGGDK